MVEVEGLTPKELQIISDKIYEYRKKTRELLEGESQTNSLVPPPPPNPPGSGNH